MLKLKEFHLRAAKQWVSWKKLANDVGIPQLHRAIDARLFS
jgi:hypothetical protein